VAAGDEQGKCAFNSFGRQLNIIGSDLETNRCQLNEFKVAMVELVYE
jgi:hypothetical protein